MWARLKWACRNQKSMKRLQWHTGWYFDFFKIAAVRHLGFVFHVTGPPTTHIWWSLLLEKFGWSPCSSFHGMNVWIFCTFGLKMPIHTPKAMGEQNLRPPSPWDTWTTSNTLMRRDRPHSPPQTASGSKQPFCHSTLSWQTHTHTHRPRNGLGDKPVPRVLLRCNRKRRTRNCFPFDVFIVSVSCRVACCQLAWNVCVIDDNT